MRKNLWIITCLLVLALSACQGRSTSDTQAVPSPSLAGIPSAATSNASEPDTGQPQVVEAPPGCTVVSPPATPGPTEQSLFPPVSEADWSFGPKDAAITLLEYSDFQ